MAEQDLTGFQTALKRASEEFKKSGAKESIKLVSNLDADGISAASIMIRAIERLGFSYSLTILHQLREQDARALSDEDFKIFVFCDLGSGQLSHLQKHLKDRKIFILDHHEVQGKPGKNTVHINPHDYGFQGSEEISAAGVCFFFATALDEKNNDLAHLALIGAIGDVQEKNGFKGLNKKILDIALKQKTIRIEKGLKLFGLETRQINKLLLYSGDLAIPGVSNDEKGVKAFLKETKIAVFEKGKPRVFYDLKKDEIQRMTEKIIQKRKQAGLANPEDVFTNVYILEGEEHGHFRDAKEFSTLLNSCGRMDNATLGIGACLGDERQRKESLKILLDYKHEIINSMNWYHKNCNCESCEKSRVIKGHNYIIINAKDEVMSTVIGTLASMISKKNDFEKNIFVLSMARNDDTTTKISLRISGNPENVDLKNIMSELIAKVGGEAGGHQYAAGAIIGIEAEEQFIEKAKEIFERQDNQDNYSSVIK